MAGLSFIAEGARLAAALREIVSIAPRAPTLPITGNILLEGDDGILRLTANNTDLMATRAIEVDLAAPGAITVSAHRLAQIVGSIEPGSQLSLEVDGSSAKIRAGRARFSIGTMPATDFPPMPYATPEARFEIDIATLRKAVATVKHSISDNEARYWLTGVYVHVVDGMLTFVTTDGDMLSRVQVPAPAGLETFGGAIVTLPFLTTLTASSASDETTAVIDFASSKVRGAVGALTVIGREIEGQFPNYQVALVRDPPISVLVDRDALEGAVQRVMLVTTLKSRRARFAFEAEKLTISSIASADELVEEVPCELRGEPVSLELNGANLSASIRALGTDTVEFGILDHHKLINLTSPMRADAALALSTTRV
ncbi:DNA polymerase III subunit beta [Sphingomonas cannabina]|uniref:DNA polymerase III subunit beta n=1 Tax=Sphingomonas cannabina TaxID=2899123 RepID=UPI001F37902C|nr:DNA polymerase III subunit beta [Sphingomonas cannabina]UIJ43707.1 DNA polymerase III subunit beta [Sphingomonas cannabina]